MEEPPMNIGKRLLALRAAQNFSQGDIEHRAGLLRCYVSRVENGHTVPNLETLERWAKALKVEVYQLFFEGEGMPEPVPTSAMDTPDRREKELLGYFRQVDEPDKKFMLDIGRKMAGRKA
jgi:transcriptional regulator with XRE-family HTH domain